MLIQIFSLAVSSAARKDEAFSANLIYHNHLFRVKNSALTQLLPIHAVFRKAF